MPRPCLSDHSELRPDECRLCWLAENDGDYQRLWDIPITAPPGGAKRNRAPAMVKPPTVPPYTGPVNSTLAVVTLAVGSAGRDLLDISGPVIERYARRIGADYRPILVEQSPWPLGEKWRVHSYFDHYDRILWLDADVLVSEDCPNLFDVVPRGSIGWHDDWPRLETTDWVTQEYQDLVRSQEWPLFDLPLKAWNSGVYVADRAHQSVFAPASKPFPNKHCSEQWHETLLAWWGKVPIYELPPELNYQWWFNYKPLTAPIEGVKVYHFAAQKDHAERQRQMLTLRKRLYPHVDFATPIPPIPPCPELGKPLSRVELTTLGIDPATCGCGNKIRHCAIHGHCTTEAPRDGIFCCATCDDHPRHHTPFKSATTDR